MASRGTEFQPKRILRTLVEHEVDFVLIGGLAGMAHGSAYPSYDVDVAYARDRDNLERLATALRALNASLRGAPSDLPFLLDAATLAAGMHFTFDTDAGPLDILSDPAGAPRYEQLKAAAQAAEVEGETILVTALDHLIAMKEASDRVKDRLMATEYRVLSDQLRAPENEESAGGGRGTTA